MYDRTAGYPQGHSATWRIPHGPSLCVGDAGDFEGSATLKWTLGAAPPGVIGKVVFKVGEAEDGGLVEFNNKLSESCGAAGCGMQGAPSPGRCGLPAEFLIQGSKVECKWELQTMKALLEWCRRRS